MDKTLYHLHALSTIELRYDMILHNAYEITKKAIEKNTRVMIFSNTKNDKTYGTYRNNESLIS